MEKRTDRNKRTKNIANIIIVTILVIIVGVLTMNFFKDDKLVAERTSVVVRVATFGDEIVIATADNLLITTKEFEGDIVEGGKVLIKIYKNDETGNKTYVLIGQ